MPRKLRKFICRCCENEFESRGIDIQFCSNSCRAKKINNLLKEGKPYNYVQNKTYYCKTCGKRLHSQTKTGYCHEHYVTDEFRKKSSETAKKFKFGGYREGSGRGKNGWYKGYWCDSSWELAWVIYNLENGIIFERNKKGFQYTYNGEIYKYYPDFIIDGKEYIEIKGWLDKQGQEKIKQFSGNLTVLFENDLLHILEYVRSKYGDDFTHLYENV